MKPCRQRRQGLAACRLLRKRLLRCLHSRLYLGGYDAAPSSIRFTHARRSEHCSRAVRHLLAS